MPINNDYGGVSQFFFIAQPTRTEQRFRAPRTLLFGEQMGGNHENSVHGLSMIAGAALGGAAIQGLHAQAKPKAYSISETEPLDAAAQAAYTPLVRTALSAAGGRTLRTAGGKVVPLEGAAAPKRVGITEWDSLEQAEAFYKSKAYTDLAPQRDKAQKAIRRYAVEVMN